MMRARMCVVATDRTSMLPWADMTAKVSVSVVIPALNEAENLRYVLPRIPSWVEQVILVDGHSTDGTVEVARSLRSDIRIICQEGEGKGAALRAGFAAASGDIIAMLDADGSTDPAELPLFVGALLAGADFAKGSRFVQGAGTADMPRHRRLGNQGFVMLVRLLFGGRYSDLCYGYNAFWKRVLPHLQLDCDGFEVETVMNVRALRDGLKVVEVPSFESARVYGEGRLRAIPDGWRVLKAIWREWQRWAPPQVFPVARGAPETEQCMPPTPLCTVGLEGESAAGRSSDPVIRPGPDVSVVICAYTELRWDRLIEAVESVQRQSLPPRETVVVVDHNETLLARLSSALPGIRTVANREDRGLSGARNTGIEATSGEWIAFLDDDAVAAEDWLERLSGHCADPATMGVGGAVWPLWPGDRPRWFPEEFDWVVGCSYRGLPELASPIRNPIGANMCLRREVCNAVGGFRAGMGRVGTNEAGCEETELCIRARQRWTGRRFVYEPLARVYHHVPESRARWSYFRARCYAEGISKGQVAQLVGRADGLAAEGTHVLRALPHGIARGIADAVLHRKLSGLARAGVIVAGLAITTAGYLVSTSGYWEAARPLARRRQGPRVDRGAQARPEVGRQAND